MSSEWGFSLCLVLTLLLLLFVVVTGLSGRRRRLHITLVLSALAALGASVFYALRMGAHYDLASAGAITPVHLWLAKLATLAYLLPITSGLLTIRDPSWRRWHRRFAFSVLALTVATAITGTWMILAAERLPGGVLG